MIRGSWIEGVRSSLADIMGQCNSEDAIVGSRLTPQEREKLQALIRKVVYFIDSRLPKTKIR